MHQELCLCVDMYTLLNIITMLYLAFSSASFIWQFVAFSEVCDLGMLIGPVSCSMSCSDFTSFYRDYTVIIQVT